MAAPGKRKGTLSLSSAFNLFAYRAVFGLLARIRPPRSNPAALGASSRVLVFSTAGLGDSLLDSAGIRAIAETFPGITIEAVVHHRRRDISQHNPYLAKLHFLRKGPLAFISLWRTLRARGPWDAVLFLSCHDPEARCLGYLLAKDATVGLAWRTRMPWLCANNIPDSNGADLSALGDAPPTGQERMLSKTQGGAGACSGLGDAAPSGLEPIGSDTPLRKAHLAVQAVRVARAVGASDKLVRMVYSVADADRAALDQKLRELHAPNEPGIVFQLGGGGAGFRDWPVEHFVELARLSHVAGIGPLILLGGPDHREKADRFAALSGELPVFDVVGRLPFPLSAALLERARCLVSTDTGIMHLGFAIGTPVVALLHPTPGPSRVGPTAELEKHVVISLPRPAGYRSPSEVSMSAIAPQQVFEGLKSCLERTAT